MAGDVTTSWRSESESSSQEGRIAGRTTLTAPCLSAWPTGQSFPTVSTLNVLPRCRPNDGLDCDGVGHRGPGSERLAFSWRHHPLTPMADQLL